ncbi:MAG: hypothetical protein LQ338_007891 [Usnochroma carphineum]|nr:MAG: hypothetical protein LQ338_007891 [Usnochroma carphineum]
MTCQEELHRNKETQAHLVHSSVRFERHGGERLEPPAEDITIICPTVHQALARSFMKRDEEAKKQRAVDQEKIKAMEKKIWELEAQAGKDRKRSAAHTTKIEKLEKEVKDYEKEAEEMESNWRLKRSRRKN